MGFCTEEHLQREVLYKAERKKQRLRLEAATRKEKQEYKAQKELRSYSYVGKCLTILALAIERTQGRRQAV